MQPSHYIPTITNYTQLWWVPNVVVAHQKEGIEAVHLASGRTVCKVNICNNLHMNALPLPGIQGTLIESSHTYFYGILKDICIKC